MAFPPRSQKIESFPAGGAPRADIPPGALLIFAAMKETTVSSARKFSGRLVNLDLLEVRLDNNRLARREVVRHPGAVAAVCRLADGRFLLVRQFRKPIERYLLEIVAGTLAPGEKPAACVRREVREETGYRVASLVKLGCLYTAPGFCDEVIHVYYARLGGRVGRQTCDPDERIERVALGGRVLERMISSGKIRDSKTLATWLLFRRRRAGL